MKLSANEKRNKELALIHIAKTQLGLDDDTYRDLLFNIAGVRSSRELDNKGREQILQHMKTKGWQKKTPARAARGAPKKSNSSIEPLIAKIGALLTEMQLPWTYAHAIARQMWKRDRLEWCKPDELRGIITALTNRLKKQNG